MLKCGLLENKSEVKLLFVDQGHTIWFYGKLVEAKLNKSLELRDAAQH